MVNIRVGSKYASEYYNRFFFPDVYKLKLMTFWIFLSTINFSHQYLPEAKAHSEPSQTSRMKIFHEKHFFQKFARKHLCRSLFLIKLQVSILQLHLTEGLQHMCFLMNFARYLRHHFTEHLQATASVLRKNILLVKW